MSEPKLPGVRQSYLLNSMTAPNDSDDVFYPEPMPNSPTDTPTPEKEIEVYENSLALLDAYNFQKHKNFVRTLIRQRDKARRERDVYKRDRDYVIKVKDEVTGEMDRLRSQLTAANSEKDAWHTELAETDRLLGAANARMEELTREVKDGEELRNEMYSTKAEFARHIGATDDVWTAIWAHIAARAAENAKLREALERIARNMKHCAERWEKFPNLRDTELGAIVAAQHIAEAAIDAALQPKL